MPLFEMQCVNGHVFDTLAASADAPPACPTCGAESSRRWAASFGLGGMASAGPSREEMPRSWAALNGGERSTVRGWHRLARERDRLEAKYPELAGDRRPFIAHEGSFAKKPLRVGDPLPPGVSHFLSSAGLPAQAGSASKGE